MYEDVLIAIDGSDVSATAATAGIELASTLEARVHVLAVVQDGRDDVETRRAQRTADVEDVVAEATEAGCEAEWAVRTGRPANEILAHADEYEVDAIVVGTHGRTGFRQVLLGSVALEVIRDARQPVLTIGPEATSADERWQLDEILLATDGWPGSVAATNHALSLAESCDATLHVLYVVAASPDVPELQSAFREHGERATTDVLERANARGIEAKRTITEGSAHETILEHAGDEAIDLLVIGTESKSRLDRFVVGSVSQRVVPNVRAPVLTVRTIEP
ncbi:universal stress protein [Natrialbaceae archaeon A-CW3]